MIPRRGGVQRFGTGHLCISYTEAKLGPDFLCFSAESIFKSRKEVSFSAVYHQTCQLNAHKCSLTITAWMNLDSGGRASVSRPLTCIKLKSFWHGVSTSQWNTAFTSLVHHCHPSNSHRATLSSTDSWWLQSVPRKHHLFELPLLALHTGYPRSKVYSDI